MGGRGAVEQDGRKPLRDDVLDKILARTYLTGIILRITGNAGNLRFLCTLGKCVDRDFV